MSANWDGVSAYGAKVSKLQPSGGSTSGVKSKKYVPKVEMRARAEEIVNRGISMGPVEDDRSVCSAGSTITVRPQWKVEQMK